MWGTQYLKQSRQFDSDVQTCHLCFLKGVLGTMRSAPTWAVLRECGHEPLRSYWFRAAVKLYNGRRKSKSELLRKVVCADCALRYRAQHCWTAEFLTALQELGHGQEHCNSVVHGEGLTMSRFCSDLRKQNREVWNAVDGLNPRERSEKLVSYHNWMAVPLPGRETQRSSLPWHLCRMLPRHVISNVSRFRLRAHHLHVEAVQPGSVIGDKCSCGEIQDEKHVLFYCRDPRVCALRERYASLFERVFGLHQHFSTYHQPYLRLHHQVDDVDVSELLEQMNNCLPYFLSELMDIFNLAGNAQQAEQPNTLAEGHPPL